MTEFKVSFQIHPKPDGGFEAVSEDPPIKFEGATRGEVEHQVRAHLVQMLGPEVAAMLPVDFSDKLQPSAPGKSSFTVKKTVRIGAGVSKDGANIASHTFTIGGTSVRTPAGNPDLYRVPQGDILSSSSASVGDELGPVRRTGDGSAAMLMLRIVIAGLVILAILFFLRK
jgi:hypothetical protein